MNLSEQAFNQLTCKQKEVWTLVMQDCLSEYVSAHILGISRDALHDRLRKARVRYRKFILENR